MALEGEQFQNTYMLGRPEWMSPEHHTHQGPEHLTKLHNLRGSIQDGQYIESNTGLARSPATGEEITTFDVDRHSERHLGRLTANNAPTPTPQEDLLPGTSRQGMLFDPYTGTGLPRDPTVSKEQRLAAVDRQLDLRGKGAPQLRETYAAGDTPVSEFDRTIVRSPYGDQSNVKMGGVPNRPKVQQGRTTRGGGAYSVRSNKATVQNLLGQTTTDYPTRSLTRPTKDATGTGTIWNPEWYTGGSSGKGKGIVPKGGKVDEEAMQPHIVANILKHAFHNPETGETLDPHTGPNEPVFLPWVDETPEQRARPRGRRYTNQISVKRSTGESPALLHGGNRWVTGTSGKPDEYKHLGRFHPGLSAGEERVGSGFVDSWATADALEALHNAGFQSELHRGSGYTGDVSHLPPGVEPEAQKTNPDRPDNYQYKGSLPQPEYLPKEEGSNPRMPPKPAMLPTKEAEGFLINTVAGGERVPEGEWRGGVDYSTTFHKRSIPSETETVERMRRVDTEWPAASTAFHERGHAIDPSIGIRTVNRGDTQTWHRDPVMEGIADADADRAVTYANHHEDALNPTINPNRIGDINHAASEHKDRHRGYGAKNEAWKDHPLTQAVYAATRIHSALSNEPNIPDRVGLVLEQHGGTHFNIRSKESTDLANETLLGKLYHENQHVRDGLDQLGFNRIGQQAAERHVARNIQKKAFPDWKRGPEQDTLFGPAWDPQE